MNELDRVISGLEEITGYSCEQMSLFDNDVFIRGIAQDAIELLKERKPRKVKNIRKVTNICFCGDCPSCGGRIYNTLNPNFCGHCGDRIDWKDGDGE